MTQQMLAAIQAQVGADQVVSARLLPTAAPEDAAKAREEVAAAKAEEVALRALRAADRSRAELEARLEGAGVEEAERRETLDSLERLGYLDDARTAALRAERLAERGYGDAYIRADWSGAACPPKPRCRRRARGGAREPLREQGRRVARAPRLCIRGVMSGRMTGHNFDDLPAQDVFRIRRPNPERSPRPPTDHR